MPLSLTRRQALAATAAAPLVAAPLPALAQDAPMTGPTSKARTFKVGDMTVTTLLAGTAARDEPQTIFGLNVDPDEFAAVSEANFIGTDMAQFYFTPTVVRTGGNTILFDTGLNPDAITAALAEAGLSPDDITHVVLTHMHGDHIGGLMTESTPTFSNAAYVTGQAEFDHWAAAGNEGFDAKVKPLAEKMSFLGDGDAVASGVTAMAAFGHTPGHMTYMLESGGAQLLLAADLANHYVWSLAYPDWEVRFDMDKAAAAASRRKILGMLAADRVPVVGYHLPFPAAGFVETRDDGFRFVPVSYQMMG
ncbi:MBL fold metallo-hydrolase [Tropicimonas marinistellae]|uniref:MBL fold metallo-hydrolase n=1 Tax=Tropicimonas marinistellae TaxID=1739787 RepID=UPI00082F0E97|nr:MBL fold metallo-hydrolase [Tropicimonas marinistellae]